MRLWSIQAHAAYEAWDQRRPFRASRRHAIPELVGAYRWMADQLRDRVGPSPIEDALPLWAWRQAHDATRLRPDLRGSGFLPRGTPGVRLELELAEDRVLLSDFQKWHCVLNDTFVPVDLAEVEAFEARLMEAGVSATGPYPEPFRTEVTRSWQRIFDIDAPASDAWEPPAERQIQAVFWELRAADVRAVQPFVAR